MTEAAGRSVDRLSSVAGHTAFALMAFSANSVLCRLALRGGAIDPASFSLVRLLAGAMALAVVVHPAWRWPSRVDWISAVVLVAYAVPFSFAYVELTTGTGALLLFGSVQVTMLLFAMWAGAELTPRQVGGVVLAFGGLTYLMMPGLSAPPFGAAALMVAAGVAWGVYSVRGRDATDPAGQTTRNFVFGVPLAAMLAAASPVDLHVTGPGVAWAVLSGAVASGLGYVVWYRALRRLSAVSAAVVQLLVPIVTALAGVFLLGEFLSLRIVLATALVLGGIALAIRPGV